MKADSPNDYPSDSQLDHNDPVWRLLGQAPLCQPDDWFTARAMARCRHAGLSVEPHWIMLGRVWRWALGGGVAVCLAVTLLVPQIHSVTVAREQKKNVQEAFEIVASLGTDSDPSSTTSASSWQDSSL